jgi:hypothetical protein
LGGNPQAIILAAGYLRNHTLKQLFFRLAECENSLGIIEDQFLESTNVETLKMHFELSIRMVQEE